MKRTIIGISLMFNGTVTSLFVLLLAFLYLPNIDRWEGPKLWFAIFGAKQFKNEVVQSLFLGFPFIVGVILFLLGFIVLFAEYFRKK